ncbi:MAG: A/G-specific adenine glycosylase [Zoogloeaceae bacterium]|jgi:A/G-specific adenine glycosylase|nr:A/G-specific adenine glycosylase [Zoogloeaceae bacterium]
MNKNTEQMSAPNAPLETQAEAVRAVRDANAFAARIVRWQRENGRHGLPWQGTCDPYPIWLSEIMLQQTRVGVVLDYFPRFLARFPDVQALAAAPQEEVLALWAGLGYYARARNLHACARQIAHEHDGIFPQTAMLLAALPGIGRSTAAAIAAFAFHERAPILDGNVKRVLCRHFAIEGVPVSAVEKSLWNLAASLLPAAPEMPAYTQGLMDLGAILCLAREPRCLPCPLRKRCRAHREGRTQSLPTPRTPTVRPSRKASFLLVTDGEHILLERRPPSGVWGGLFALPEGREWISRLKLHAVPLQPLPFREHVFTHFRLEISPFLCQVAQMPELPDDSLVCVTLSNAQKSAIPAPVARLLEEVQKRED